MTFIHRILIAFLLLFSLCSFADDTLNIYCWSNYLPPSIIQKFESETHIQVVVTDYDSNETMYARLKVNPHLGYDLVVPSTDYIEKMTHEGMLLPIDKQSLTNLKNLNPLLLKRHFDPDNRYSLPYVWGATGILVNKNYWDPKTIHSFRDLWQPRFKNQLLLLDDIREVFSMALLTLGYSLNDRNPQHIKAAYSALHDLLPNVKVFNSDASISIYVDEDVTVGMVWSGEAFQAIRENPDLTFIYPQEGFPLWIDSLAIPVNAPHYQNALKFINFLMRPEIAKEIVVQLGYPVANTTAMQYLSPALRNNPVLNPGDTALKHSEVGSDLGPAISIYQAYWQQLKVSI